MAVAIQSLAHVLDWISGQEIRLAPGKAVRVVFPEAKGAAVEKRWGTLMAAVQAGGSPPSESWSIVVAALVACILIDEPFSIRGTPQDRPRNTANILAFHLAVQFVRYQSVAERLGRGPVQCPVSTDGSRCDRGARCSVACVNGVAVTQEMAQDQKAKDKLKSFKAMCSPRFSQPLRLMEFLNKHVETLSANWQAPCERFARLDR